MILKKVLRRDEIKNSYLAFRTDFIACKTLIEIYYLSKIII